MSKDAERRVRVAMTDLIGRGFEDILPELGTPEKADGWVKFSEDRWLILELEDGQKHRTTNVLKYLRFLSGNSNISIILAHVYFPDSTAVNSSRGELAAWLGNQMERQYLPERFFYRRLIINRDYNEWINGADELLEDIKILDGS